MTKPGLVKVPIVNSRGVATHVWRSETADMTSDLPQSARIIEEAYIPSPADMFRPFDPDTEPMGKIIAEGVFSTEGDDGDTLITTIPSYEVGGLVWEELNISDVTVYTFDDGSAHAQVEIPVYFPRSVDDDWVDEHYDTIGLYLNQRFGFEVNTTTLTPVDQGVLHCRMTQEISQDDTFNEAMGNFVNGIEDYYRADSSNTVNLWDDISDYVNGASQTPLLA